MSSSPESAAAVYALADALVHLRHRGGVAWCADHPDDDVLATVDCCVGRALKRVKYLLATTEGAAAAAACVRLRNAVDGAWEDFRQAWRGDEHKEVTKGWPKVEAEGYYRTRSLAIERSPLAGRAWRELDDATADLQAALPADLQTCFTLSCRLADELYPTLKRDRRVEGLDVFEPRYLTVELDDEVKQSLADLSASFGALRDLDHDLSEETEGSATRKIDRLHRAILQCLTVAAGAGPPAPEVKNSTSDDAGPVSPQGTATAQAGEGQAAAPRAAVQDGATNQPVHSDDFRSVNWYGHAYEFNASQAACVKVLWEHWERGTPVVSADTLLAAAEWVSSRMSLLFRGHPAWNTMIVRAKARSAYRLNPPSNS